MTDEEQATAGEIRADSQVETSADHQVEKQVENQAENRPAGPSSPVDDGGNSSVLSRINDKAATKTGLSPKTRRTAAHSIASL